MPATKIAYSHTEDGEAFSPVTKDLHPHGEAPDAPPPETSEALADELGRLAGKLYDAYLILRRISGRFEMPEHEEEHGTVMAAAGLADRAHTRLNEVDDALRREHTKNVGFRMHDMIVPVQNGEALLSDWMGGYPSEAAESVAGTVYAALWTLSYVGDRLIFLTEESELPLD